MPVQDFQGNTFVAFTDISGFKEMMKGDGSRAINALDKLNQAGFDSLNNSTNVNGFFISDCGVLFVKNSNLSKIEQFEAILRVIKEINKKLLSEDIMLTTSIAYGQFSYDQRIEFDGISKDPIYGNAYVSAFLDNETGTPKMQPGQCRIVANNINDDVWASNSFLKKIRNHIYYYWMLNDYSEIESFEREYKDTYQLKFKGMLSVLQRNNG